MKKTDVAREYRVKFGMEMPTLKLARIMYNENTLLFQNLENARSHLRAIEGKAGPKFKVSDKSMFTDVARPKNPYNLPKSEEVIWEPYYVKAKKVGLLFDIHAPYHNESALTAAITWLKNEKVDTVVLGGDLFDFHGLSRFLRDPRKKNFAYELDCGAAIINILQKELDCRIVYKLGNHCERYQNFLWQKAGEIADVEDFQLKNLLIKRGCNIELVDDKRIVKLGGLNLIHGHEFVGGAFGPVNIARGLYNKGKTSAIQGHNHQTSEHTEPDMNDKVTTTWSAGCLCELHPAYMPINKWNHGAALVELDGEDFHVQNKRIYKGKIL